MRKIFPVLVVMALGVFLVAGSAIALPISGEIHFAGGFTPVGGSGLLTATGLDFSTSSQFVLFGSGDLALAPGTSAAFTNFTFDPSLNPSPVAPLWTAGIFAFDM